MSFTVDFDNLQSNDLGSFGQSIIVGRNWQGSLANIRFYKAGLSAAEIQTSYQSGRFGSPANTTALNFWAPLHDAPTGSTVTDQSSTNATGTITGGTLSTQLMRTP